MKNLKNLITYLLLITCSQSFSITDDVLLNKVINELKIPKEKVMFDLVAQKQLPYSKEKTVFVIPKYADNDKDFDESYFVLA